MDTLEKYTKTAVLSMFCFLNVIDLVQTMSFLRMGIEGNRLAVFYPQLWFILKVSVAFGLPLGLYKLDEYLETKEDEGFVSNLRLFVGFVYLVIFFADVFYFSIVLGNMRILGRLFRL